MLVYILNCDFKIICFITIDIHNIKKKVVLVIILYCDDI